MLRFVSLVVLSIAAAGCWSASPYVYRPEAQATATIGHHSAADYQIPLESPMGDVRIASLGVTKLKPTDKGPSHAMLVQMILANTSDDEPWAIDTRSVVIEYPGGDCRVPAYVGGDVDPESPIVNVPRGQRRSLDFYYRLPAKMDSEDRIPAFDVAWEVTTGPRLVAERTPFARMRVPPTPSYGELGGADYDPLKY